VRIARFQYLTTNGRDLGYEPRNRAKGMIRKVNEDE